VDGRFSVCGKNREKTGEMQGEKSGDRSQEKKETFSRRARRAQRKDTRIQVQTGESAAFNCPNLDSCDYGISLKENKKIKIIRQITVRISMHKIIIYSGCI
jgi:hypothetical protein